MTGRSRDGRNFGGGRDGLGYVNVHLIAIKVGIVGAGLEKLNAERVLLHVRPRHQHWRQTTVGIDVPSRGHGHRRRELDDLDLYGLHRLDAERGLTIQNHPVTVSKLAMDGVVGLQPRFATPGKRYRPFFRHL